MASNVDGSSSGQPTLSAHEAAFLQVANQVIKKNEDRGEDGDRERLCAQTLIALSTGAVTGTSLVDTLEAAFSNVGYNVSRSPTIQYDGTRSSSTSTINAQPVIAGTSASATSATDPSKKKKKNNKKKNKKKKAPVADEDPAVDPMPTEDDEKSRDYATMLSSVEETIQRLSTGSSFPTVAKSPAPGAMSSMVHQVKKKGEPSHSSSSFQSTSSAPDTYTPSATAFDDKEGLEAVTAAMDSLSTSTSTPYNPIYTTNDEGLLIPASIADYEAMTNADKLRVDVTWCPYTSIDDINAHYDNITALRKADRTAYLAGVRKVANDAIASINATEAKYQENIAWMKGFMGKKYKAHKSVSENMAVMEKIMKKRFEKAKKMNDKLRKELGDQFEDMSGELEELEEEK